MNEFIVWNNKKKIFCEDTIDDEFLMDIEGNACCYHNEGYDNYLFNYKKEDDIYILKYIGLKDINGKSIYADCSILEMYRGLDSFVGYYTYNKNKAHYEFIILDGCDNDSFGNIVGSSLKIIDTIQENKLALIKG